MRPRGDASRLKYPRHRNIENKYFPHIATVPISDILLLSECGNASNMYPITVN